MHLASARIECLHLILSVSLILRYWFLCLRSLYGLLKVIVEHPVGLADVLGGSNVLQLLLKLHERLLLDLVHVKMIRLGSLFRRLLLAVKVFAVLV